jgi:hypothetical protein
MLEMGARQIVVKTDINSRPESTMALQRSCNTQPQIEKNKSNKSRCNCMGISVPPSLLMQSRLGPLSLSLQTMHIKKISKRREDKSRLKQ